MKNIFFLNATPHYITIGSIQIPASGLVFRLNESTEIYDIIDGIPVVKVEYSPPSFTIPDDLIPLLQKQNPKILVIICSSILYVLNDKNWKEIAARFKYVCPNIERILFISPDTGPNSAIRNNSGQIIGVKRCRLLKEILL